jgi:hypothetical protein
MRRKGALIVRKTSYKEKSIRAKRGDSWGGGSHCGCQGRKPKGELPILELEVKKCWARLSGACL